MQKLYFKVSLLLLSLVLSQFAWASNHPRQLEKINDKIATIKASLDKAQTKRSVLENDLAKIEIASGETQQKLTKIKKQLSKQQQNWQAISHQVSIYQQQLKTKESILTNQIRTVYMLGREPYLKLLLSQHDNSTLNRTLNYFHYVINNQTKNISYLESILSKLNSTEQQLQQQFQTLQQLKIQQIAGKNKLFAIKKQRLALIQQINRQIDSRSKKLQQLLINKRRLERTLTRLEKSASHHKIAGKNFAKLYGKLTWPTQGIVVNNFGRQISKSELRWGGVLIKASEDQPVHAIADGKVVFAKWLSGYGLLLIISHGHGYMTLYGRNHYLYKKVGDTVHAGDVIAAVGKTGGYQKTALYFAIRYDAKPLNPDVWCTKKRRSA